jgi:hypothetical protein
VPITRAPRNFANTSAAVPTPDGNGGHQQGLALQQLAAGEEPVMDDDKDHRHRRRLGPVERRRRRHHLARVEQRELGEPAGAAAHHPVAFPEAGNAGPDLDDFARGVAAASARLLCRPAGLDPHRVQPAEFGTVDRRRAHPHQHLAGADNRPLHVAHIPRAARGAGNHDRCLHAAPPRCVAPVL